MFEAASALDQIIKEQELSTTRTIQAMMFEAASALDKIINERELKEEPVYRCQEPDRSLPTRTYNHNIYAHLHACTQAHYMCAYRTVFSHSSRESGPNRFIFWYLF